MMPALGTCMYTLLDMLELMVTLEKKSLICKITPNFPTITILLPRYPHIALLFKVDRSLLVRVLVDDPSPHIPVM
jgi:hypothetical protein